MTSIGFIWYRKRGMSRRRIHPNSRGIWQMRSAR